MAAVAKIYGPHRSIHKLLRRGAKNVLVKLLKNENQSLEVVMVRLSKPIYVQLATKRTSRIKKVLGCNKITKIYTLIFFFSNSFIIRSLIYKTLIQ